MAPSSHEQWSITRSVAFLAAVMAIMLAVLLPSAVAASPATGAPIMLCSGQQMWVVLDADGDPKPVKDPGAASLSCAMCLMAGMTTLPPPPPPAVPTRLAPPVVAPFVMAAVSLPPPARGPPRPPSTAPPQA